MVDICTNHTLLCLCLCAKLCGR